MRRFIPALLGCVLMASAGAADLKSWGPGTKLDRYFDALEQNKLASGSVAISEKGVLRYQRSVGFATIENGTPYPADAGTRYRIGPLSKLFTAVLVMQLVEGASITLDSKLAEFYPDLPNALDISYRDLLQHRSGLANYTETQDFSSWRTTPKAHANLLKVIAAGGARFKPGERVEYNDTNYLLLGYVLEKIYERSFDEIIRKQIADKIGLSRSYYAGTGNSRLESISYAPAPDGWNAQVDTDPSIDGGAGGMISNAGDLVRFMDALFAGKLVTEHSLNSMRSQDGGSGMGLWPIEVAAQPGFGQEGGVGAFHAAAYHFPTKGLSIAWTGNASVQPMSEIVHEVLATVLERGHKPALKRAE